MHTTHDFSRGPESIPAEQQLLKQIATGTRLLGVCPRTIDNWVRQRVIPSIPISARCRRFIAGSVIAALRRLETEVSDE